MILFEIVGLEKMQRRLDEISMGCNRAMRLGCLHTAERIERMAKILCPVKTGYLRSSIRADVLGDSGAYASAGGSYKGTHGVMRDVEYAVYVNYGTGRYATGPGGSRMKNPNGGMQARPFFTNAVNYSLPFIYQDVQVEVDKLLHAEAT